MIRAIAVGLAIVGMHMGLSTSTVVHAETSAEYVLMGQKIWPAFTCSVAASILKDHEAQQRLFKLGYEGGKKFIGAIQENKVTEEELRSSGIGVNVLLSLSGPTPDFVMGTIWSQAADHFYDEISEECTSCMTGEIRRMWVEKRYRDMNCDVIE